MNIEDPQTIIEGAIKPLKARSEGHYTFIDRHRDFHKVFGSDEGKRVLRQIIDLCEGSLPNPDDPHPKLTAYVARRRLGLQILAITSVPPPAE